MLLLVHKDIMPKSLIPVENVLNVANHVLLVQYQRHAQNKILNAKQMSVSHVYKRKYFIPKEIDVLMMVQSVLQNILAMIHIAKNALPLAKPANLQHNAKLVQADF